MEGERTRGWDRAGGGKKEEREEPTEKERGQIQSVHY